MQTTVINRQLNISRVTRLNPYLAASTVTLVNPYLQDQRELQGGNLLGSRFLLGEKLDAAAGEADLFFCTDTAGDPQTRYVAKVYRRNMKVDRGVTEIITHLDSPAVGKCYEAGEWNGRAYEIIPYYEKGSLLGQTCSYEELRSVIIPSLNEALKTLHDAGIIHKDLKPSNIMRRDDGGVAVIDFGVSSVIEEGLTMLVDTTGMTPAYSAPETFRDIFLRESDYYSLGITVFELYTGRQPYTGLSGSDLERLVSVQRIPLPEDMPPALQDLITGLTYSDISNRRDKANPNRRWTYEEVARWLSGEKQPVPGRSGSLLEQQPYEFSGAAYEDLAALADALAVNWDAGKEELFRGRLTAYFERVSDTVAEICRSAEERASEESGQDDLIFWDTVYRLDPECRRLYWKGGRWENLPALGREILDNRKEFDGVRKLAGDMLKHRILSRYMDLFGQDGLTDQRKHIATVTALYLDANRERERERYLYELGYLLSGQVVLSVGDRQFFTVAELNEYMAELERHSFKELKTFCGKLLGTGLDLKPQFEVWLIAQGKGSAVRNWKKEYGLIREERNV